MRNAFWIFFFAILILLVFVPQYTRLQDLQQKNNEYAAEIEARKEKNRQLLEEELLLREDPVYLERVAREKLGIAREGEVVYRIKPVVQETAE